jgi:hypothetical protein
MSIGASLFLIATGAILRYAVTAHVNGVNLETVGGILMIVGIIGLIFSLLWMLMYADRRRHVEPGVVRERERVRDRDLY